MATMFDGVEIKPPKQDPPGYLTLAMLVANCWLEAEKVKEERLARERGGEGAADDAPTLETIMERAGLKIPGIKEAIAQLMGDGDEVKQAMGLLGGSADPAKVLQGFLAQAVQQHLAGAGLNTAPPNPTSAKSPAQAATSTKPPAQERPTAPVLPLFRPEFTHEAREAAKTSGVKPTAPVSPTSPTGHPQFRPEFTREARPASKLADRLAQHAAAPSATAPASAADPTPAASPMARPSLVELIGRRVDKLRQQTREFQTMLEARLTSAENRIAALHEELRRLLTKQPAATERTSTQQELPFAPPAQAPASEPAASEGPAASPAAATDESLPAATEAEVLRAVEIVEEVADEIAEQQAQSLARVEVVEHEVLVLEEAVRVARAAQERATGDD